MNATTLKRQLKKIDFVQFTAVPLAREIEYRLAMMRGPKLLYSFISDLKSIAPAKGWTYHMREPSQVLRREPSLALTEDTLLIAKNGANMIRRHRETRQDRDVRRGEMHFSHLTAVTQYPVPETFICEIPDVFLQAPEGGMVTSHFEILTQSAVRGVLGRPPVMATIPGDADRLGGKYVSLCGWSARANYAHWLLDILPRLMLLEEIPADLRFLLPADFRPFQAESLKLLGVPENRLLPVLDGWYRLDQALLCHPAERSIVPHPRHICQLRDRLTEVTVGADRKRKPWRKVYISRGKSRRKLVNEQELMPILQRYGFETHHCEDLTFSQQVRLFSEADVVLGHHGAGMANILFCDPETRIIEIYNPVWWNHCFCRLAHILGHQHWFSFGENRGPENDSYVAPKKLDKLLAYALSQDKMVEDYF